MIAYPMRYRGPFEYEKFILNIMQYANEVTYLSQYELTGTTNGLEDYISLQSIYQDFLKTFNTFYDEEGVSTVYYRYQISLGK